MQKNHQWVALYTIIRKEVVRFTRIWPQTLVPPVISQSLYFLIFGKFIGSQINQINGVSYMAFIVPGLVMMAVINNSYANVSSSFFSNKFQRSIEEILVSPVEDWVIVLGYTMGGVLRGLSVGFLVFLVSIFFTHPAVHHLGFMMIFMTLVATLFSLGGLLNGILGKKFDDISIVPNFILLPLTYLGGVFYSVSLLPPFWQKISQFNPILYMVNGFRFGFHGISDVNIGLSLAILLILTISLLIFNLYAIKRGVGLKT